MSRGRKSADVDAVGGVLLRQRVWDEIRRCGDGWWTIATLASVAKADPAAVQSYTLGLQRAGVIVSRRDWDVSEASRRHQTCGPSFDDQDPRFRLLCDLGVQAPRVTASGRLLEGLTAQEAIWRAIRVLGRFNWVDLHAAVSSDDRPVKPATVKAYLADLHAAGYLKQSLPSRPGAPALWVLRPDRDTGPRAPMVQRTKTVFDPNEGKVVQRWTDHEDAPVATE